MLLECTNERGKKFRFRAPMLIYINKRKNILYDGSSVTVNLSGDIETIHADG